MSARHFFRARILAGLVSAALLFTAGCATETQTPTAKPGSPEFNWKAAVEAYKQADYVKAANLLGDLAQKENEYSAKAAPMALILTHGMTHAYFELADKYAAGAKRTRANSAAFYRLTSEYRSKASATGLRYAELSRKFGATLKEGDIVIPFEMPTAESADPAQYKRIENGTMIPAAEIPMIEGQGIARWAMKSAANVAGAKDKPEKAKEAFASGEAKIPQAVFMPALAFSLYETAEMFGPKKLNQPNRVILALCAEAEKIISKAKPTKESGELLKKIKAIQKKAETAG